MGIGGHILGEKKLRRLCELTGLELDRAYRRGSQCEGREVIASKCHHYRIDWDTGQFIWLSNDDVIHWASCPLRKAD